MVFIDTEVYRNYFLFCALSETGERFHVELFSPEKKFCENGCNEWCLGNSRRCSDCQKSDVTTREFFCVSLGEKANTIENLLNNKTTVSFNGINYDLPILSLALLQQKANHQIKALSDDIIMSDDPSWKVIQKHAVSIPDRWDHIDLFNVAPSMASLKAYGGRMGAKKLQDLPISPDAIITEEQRKELISYCFNDCETTKLLYEKLKPQIKLREELSKQYRIDLRSKSDAQIAEHIIKSEVQALTGKSYYKPEVPEDYTFHYQDSGIIKFKTDDLNDLYQRVLNHEFSLKSSGKVDLPEFTKTEKILIGRAQYKIGNGGLHSCEKDSYVESTDKYKLIDLDVASYYPSIILHQRLSPQSFGAPFLSVYSDLVKRRLDAKRSGDNVTADTLKIAINGCFGKLGSIWSPLYAPELLIQTTLTGQFALLMLIESLELASIPVVSANTDGIVVKCYDENILDEVTFLWMLQTTFILESNRYDALISRDVNNYIAVKSLGHAKVKGIFSPPSLSKNPDFPIIYKSVVDFFTSGIAVKNTIRECLDVNQFLSLRKVTGGAQWCGEFLGKAVRFYYSSDIDDDIVIQYVKNSNKVPKSNGSRPLMNLPDTLPTDIDYERYIAEALALISKLTKNK